ncbi:hypothetical protein BH10PLA1_BH10PLA1_05210 [soil metagenome]
MFFSVLMLLLVVIVAYFHYLQGFFSATISAVIAAVSVLVAFTYYEPIIDKISPGKFADSAHGMMLPCLFALTYVMLRLVFDKLIPGNVRLNSTLDKIGGAVMGLIAGILATGTLAVSAQAMPFGPSIAGYARYRLQPEQVVIVSESARQMADRRVYDEMAGYSISTKDDHPVAHESLNLLPVDDMTINFLYHCSDGGSTAGSQPFSRIHPDYLQELFGNRIGIQVGARRSAQIVGGEDVVSVERIYTLDSIPQMDAEVPSLRKRDEDNLLPKVLKADSTHALMVVRVQFKLNASDADKIVRVSTGSVRMVVSTTDDAGRVTYQNVFPVGTVEDGNELLVNKPDEFMFVKADKAADFLFVVPPSVLPDMKITPVMFPEDSDLFVEIKRFARIPLAGMKLEKPDAFDQTGVLRKAEIRTALAQVHPTPEMVKARLIGAWNTTTPAGPAVFTYKPDNTFREEIQANGTLLAATGKWEVISSAADGLVFDRKLDAGGPVARKKVVFSGPDAAAMTDVNNPGKSPLTLKRKP